MSVKPLLQTQDSNPPSIPLVRTASQKRVGYPPNSISSPGKDFKPTYFTKLTTQLMELTQYTISQIPVKEVLNYQDVPDAKTKWPGYSQFVCLTQSIHFFVIEKILSTSNAEQRQKVIKSLFNEASRAKEQGNYCIFAIYMGALGFLKDNVHSDWEMVISKKVFKEYKVHAELMDPTSCYGNLRNQMVESKKSHIVVPFFQAFQTEFSARKVLRNQEKPAFDAANDESVKRYIEKGKVTTPNKEWWGPTKNYIELCRDVNSVKTTMKHFHSRIVESEKTSPFEREKSQDIDAIAELRDKLSESDSYQDELKEKNRQLLKNLTQ